LGAVVADEVEVLLAGGAATGQASLFAEDDPDMDAQIAVAK
jgi:hypothetical protein